MSRYSGAGKQRAAARTCQSSSTELARGYLDPRTIWRGFRLGPGALKRIADRQGHSGFSRSDGGRGHRRRRYHLQLRRPPCLTACSLSRTRHRQSPGRSGTHSSCSRTGALDPSPMICLKALAPRASCPTYPHEGPSPSAMDFSITPVFAPPRQSITSVKLVARKLPTRRRPRPPFLEESAQCQNSGFRYDGLSRPPASS